MKSLKHLPPNHQQNGAILVSGLIFLLILTIIGVSSMQSVSLTEKMTSNLRDTHLAFQATESALADGERWIHAQQAQPTAVESCGSPPCQLWGSDILGTVYSKNESWWQSNATNYSSSLYGLSAQPQYVIEEYTFVPFELSPDAQSKGHGYHYYKVTARGKGKQSTSSTILESIYSTQYN